MDKNISNIDKLAESLSVNIPYAEMRKQNELFIEQVDKK